MRYALLVLEAPGSHAASHTALRFARAALARGHRIQRVFFYSDGVHNGSALAVVPQDEPELGTEWRQFALTHGVELVVCIAAALRRGLLDETERDRYERSAANLDPAFVLSGLGQLAEATLDAERIVTFGG